MSAGPRGWTDPGVYDRLGRRTVDILYGATRVETFRVGRAPTFGDKSKALRIDNVLLSSSGKLQGKAFADRLRTVLMDARMYPSMHDRCLFDPGVLFRLWRGREVVNVILCFHCDDALIVTHDAQGKVVHSLMTGFGSVRPRLLALAREALPGDAEIRALK